MRSRLAVGCALVLAAAAPAFAQDTFEPNPSLARLSADDAYARTSAKSVRTAGTGAPHAIRLDDAGRVLVAASGEPPRVARLDADGRLDATFGDAGVAELPVWGGGERLGLEVDAAGRIVVTGSFYETGTYPWVPDYAGRVYGAARLLADGSLDPDFSGDGLRELDPASGLSGLGAVHASGTDGAMLALAQKLSPSGSYYPLVGLVRIAADGTIDASYGGGFAQIAEVSPIPPFAAISEDVQVADFAVDAVGRAVVAVRDRYGYGFTVRLDTAGGLDPSFWTPGYYSGSNFAASQIALDGAGRIVGMDDANATLLRRLPDGAPDRTFSGDGFAWNQAAFFLELTWAQRAVLYAQMSMDPDFAGVLNDRKLLAVATRADRWALARVVNVRNRKGRGVARGIEVRAIDPADPGAIVSTTYRFPDQRYTNVAGLVVAPDGTAAYALGDTFVLRVDLAKRKALPLPDLRAKWLDWPHVVDFGGGRYRVSARVRVSNVARHDAASVYGFVGFGDGGFAIPLDPYATASTTSRPFRLRARSSVVKRFSWEGGDMSTDLAGARLSIKIACELPDANSADNTATSRTITPVYAGKR